MRSAILVIMSIFILSNSLMAQPIAHEVDPGSRPRISTRWEETPFRQMVYDDPLYIRNESGRVIEIVVSAENTQAGSAKLHQVMDTTKVYDGCVVKFLPGIHRADSTLTFGSNTTFVGVSGSTESSTLTQPIIRLFGNASISNRHHNSLFAVDTVYFNTLSTTPAGNTPEGYVKNVVFENLRLEYSTDASTHQRVPLIGLDLRGVAYSKVDGIDINNFLFGIVVGASECDSLFYINDGDWDTKGWLNTIQNCSINNSWWQSNFGTAAVADTFAAYGGAAIVATVANQSLVKNNEFGYQYGPRIFVPLISSMTIEGNNIESAAARDTLSPWVIVGSWTDPTADGRADYDSTHMFANTDSDCASYNYPGGDATLNVFWRGTRNVVIKNNRFESNDKDHAENLYIGPNAKETVVEDNSFSRTSTGGTADHYAVQDYGIGTRFGINAWPSDGRDENWEQGDKALIHAINASPAGAEIHLGARTYYVDFSADNPDNFISIPSNLRLIGHNTTIALADTVNPNTWDDSTGIFNIAPGDSNIWIQGITFDGNADGQAYTGTGSWNTAAVWGKNNIMIVMGNNSSGTVRDVSIIDCVFKDFCRGIQLRADGTFMDNINIIGNKFTPNGAIYSYTGTYPDINCIGVLSDQGSVQVNGLRVINNTIFDYGIENNVYSSAECTASTPKWCRVHCYFPDEVLSPNEIANSVVQNNFVNVITSGTESGVDTLFTYDGFLP